MKMRCLILNALLVSIMGMAVSAQDAGHLVKPYNVVWESPSVDASGQMPLGNGDVAAGVYAIEDDALYLLLAKNDAFNYNGDLFKTGRVKIELSPNPLAKGKPFKQTLDLETGSILIEADGVTIRVWADANKPVYHVEIDSPKDIAVTAASDLWERIDGCPHNCTKEPIDPPTQDVRLQRDGKILWYFAVGDRSVYPTELEYYEVEHMASEFADPYRFNTFGNLTAGQRNGFLIDCWPDLSLRVIVGPRQDDFPDVLEADAWQHIAVVFSKGRLDAYLNGNKLQKQ